MISESHRSWPFFSLSTRWYQNHLALYQEAWRECFTHYWVLVTLTMGYRLQFAVKTPSFQLGQSITNGDSAQVLNAEISS